MNHPVVTALTPVVALIALGYLLGWRGWVGRDQIRRLSSLVFLLLTPVLLFRTMARVDLSQLDWQPALAYFLVVALIFLATLIMLGLKRESVVFAMTGSYGNLVMIGIPLISLAYGEAALVTLLTLVAMHSLVLLGSGTVVLELVLLRDKLAERGPMLRAIAQALRSALIHPVPLPIIAGLLFAFMGGSIAPWIDLPMAWISKAFAPLALLLVGLTLSTTRIGDHLRAALALTAIKNLLMPVLVFLIAWGIGVEGLPLSVLLLAAGLPIGANAFMFAQRYAVAQGEVTAAVAVSTVLSLFTLSLLIALRAP